jgi:hypothetical protein
MMRIVDQIIVTTVIRFGKRQFDEENKIHKVLKQLVDDGLGKKNSNVGDDNGEMQQEKETEKGGTTGKIEIPATRITKYVLDPIIRCFKLLNGKQRRAPSFDIAQCISDYWQSKKTCPGYNRLEQLEVYTEVLLSDGGRARCHPEFDIDGEWYDWIREIPEQPTITGMCEELKPMRLLAVFKMDGQVLFVVREAKVRMNLERRPKLLEKWIYNELVPPIIYVPNERTRCILSVSIKDDFGGFYVNRTKRRNDETYIILSSRKEQWARTFMTADWGKPYTKYHQDDDDE